MSLSMLFMPLTAWVMMKARPARAYWGVPPIAIVGLGLLQPAYADCVSPQPGWFLLTALVQSIWFAHQQKRPRGAADPADYRAARHHRDCRAGDFRRR